MLYFFISLIFVNLFIYYENYLFLIFLFIFIYFLGKRVPFNLYVVCCVSIALFFSFNLNYYKVEIKSYDVNRVLEILESYDNYSIVKDEEIKYLVYNKDNEFKEGNKILFKGRLINIEESYNSFYNYLNKKNVNYELDYYSCQIIDDSVSFNVMIVDKLLHNKSEKSKSYLKLILFNVKDDNSRTFYDNFSLYSLTYLIAVSGFHINLLLNFFKKIFGNRVIGVAIVSFYIYLLNFSVSSYRAFLCYIFKNLNKKLNFDLTNIEIISLIGCVFIVCNPYMMFSFSFIFSFLSTFVLEIFKLYKKRKFNNMFYVYLVNIPLILLNYFKLNVSSLFFSVVLNGPVSFLYIFSFLFLFLDKFYLIYELIIGLFYRTFEILNNFNFILVLGKPNLIFFISYYLILVYFFIFKERKSKISYIYLSVLFLILIGQYCKPILSSQEQVYFLNVGQGDCVVFLLPNSKEAILIDTGGSKYKDVAKNEIIPFLESKGINKVRNVIITHDDFDHNGSLSSLKENFEVGNVMDSSLIESVQIGEKTFKNLNISEDRDNDGSLVLYGEYAGFYILLMGDASKNIENKIMDELGKVDIIKIGHHGSDTSSGYEFLDRVNGKFAIISVGENNSYGHPHVEVIKNLEKLGYHILRTDKNNDIGFGRNIFNITFIDYFK